VVKSKEYYLLHECKQVQASMEKINSRRLKSIKVRNSDQLVRGACVVCAEQLRKLICSLRWFSPVCEIRSKSRRRLTFTISLSFSHSSLDNVWRNFCPFETSRGAKMCCIFARVGRYFEDAAASLCLLLLLCARCSINGF